MPTDLAKRMRSRAKDCRDLAKGARQNVDRIMLEDMAADLEQEADAMEAEEDATSRPAPNDRTN